MAALNQIFFGPPGTGKTYATIEATLQILDPAFLQSHQHERKVLKQRFDELAAAGNVRFVTFHQSFSYEDFVEGLRADTGPDGQLRYSVVPGVFKSLCQVQRSAYRPFSAGDKYGTGYKVIYASQDVVELEKPKGKHLEFGMSLLNGLADAVLAGQVTLEDLRNQTWDAKLPNSNFDPFIVNGYKNCLPSMVEHMIGGQGGGLFERSIEPAKPTAKVLIIDEINRGNVSRIFGELITLIEPSKRAGADEALEILLPYSKERFSVPSNVHLIGTMNTADRSLAALDIALRRRFTFVEVPPNPALLNEVMIEGVDVATLLSVMNDRISVLLDCDHCLGHAYFMPLKDERSLERLESIFRQQILPLLQEYFFEDWQRIQWVLNDQRKAVQNQFLLQPSQDMAQLFGDAVSVGQHSERWELNDDAFTRVEAYLGIIDHTATAAAVLPAREARDEDVLIRQLPSATIEVFKNGKLVSPVKPVLRDIAHKHNVSLIGESGATRTTRALGSKVIDALLGLER